MTTQPHLVESSPIRNLEIPSRGLHQSFLGAALDMELESGMDNAELTLEQGQELFEFIWDEMDNKKYSNKLCHKYTEWLLGKIESQYSIDLPFSNVEYYGITPQNCGDQIFADVDVSKLPSIDELSVKLGVESDDFKSRLIANTKEKLTSCSGFISFYSNDITPLLYVEYERWNTPYLNILLQTIVEFMKQATNPESAVSDLSVAFLDNLTCNGGAMDILWDCVDKDASEYIQNRLK